MEDGRPRVTVILDPDVKDVVERQAQSERGTLSGVCRRVISDWAASRTAREAEQVVAA
jgi:hypothetical protein